MKKIKIGITGCLGMMGQELIKAANKDKRILISSLTESKKYNKKINQLSIQNNSIEAFKNTDVIIDFTTPECTMQVLEIAAKLKKKIVIGTTGFTEKQENFINKLSKKYQFLNQEILAWGLIFYCTLLKLYLNLYLMNFY